MDKIIGIDLGTTNSVVSVIENGKPVVIVNDEGKRTTPSIVAFLKDGERKVGDSAKRQAVTNPTKTVYSIKRFMGKSMDDVKSEISRVPYKVIANGDNQPSVQIDDRTFTPQELSAMVIQKLKKSAEAYLGYEVNRAVITVPAYFNDQERQATIAAGAIAGLQVERIINEPTAAALAYGLDKQDEQKIIAVFDLGGGTFDISILELGDGVFEVLSTNGDVHLGGDNVDEILVDFIANQFKSDHNIDLRKDPMALQRIKEASEKAKIELSSSQSTEINLPYITVIDGVPQHFVTTVTRAKFESLISDFLTRVLKPCEIALKESGKKIDEIDEVILVGGSTRIPAVQELIKKFFKKEPNRSVNPDEAVSLGAAVQGGVLTKEVTDVLLLDVTPLTLGIEVLNGEFSKLIPANTTIPTRKSQVYSTAADNQPAVDIRIAQGERVMFSDNKALGEFQLSGIMPAPRGVPQIEVTFDIDANGVLTVSAKDKTTGKDNKITISNSGQLSEDDIKRMREDAEQNAEADRVKKEELTVVNSGESTYFTAESMLKDHESKMESSDVDTIKINMGKLRTALDTRDINEIKLLTDKLNTSIQSASSKMYENTQAESEAENDDTTERSSKTQADSTEDVEYTEVN